jgi:hypothetical protein
MMDIRIGAAYLVQFCDQIRPFGPRRIEASRDSQAVFLRSKEVKGGVDLPLQSSALDFT